MSTGNITGNVQVFASLDGVSINQTITCVGSAVNKPSLRLPAALAGELTARSSDTVGIITFAEAHGLTSETLAVFWEGGRAYQVSITGHDSLTLNVNASVGDALPALNSLVTVAPAQEVADGVSIPGADIEELLIQGTQYGLCVLIDGSAANKLVADIDADTPHYTWPVAEGQAKPFSGTVVKVQMYNAATQASTMTVAALLS